MAGENSGEFNAEMALKLGVLEGKQDAMKEDIDELKKKFDTNTALLHEIRNGQATIIDHIDSHADQLQQHSSAIKKMGSGENQTLNSSFFSKRQRELIIAARDKAITYILIGLFVAAFWYFLEWANSNGVRAEIDP
jgi:methyl-accepting chemotaxis protein